MKSMPLILLAILVVLVSASCTADPRKSAQAYAIETEADQAAADAEQAREQDAELHQAEMERLAIEQQNREAWQASWQAAVKLSIDVGKWFAALAISMALVSLGVSASITSLGLSRVTVRAAEVRANLIPLDRNTRQFPVFIQHVHGTRYALINPNTDSVRMLDTSHEADRQMIAAMGATQLAGVIAPEAARSSDPAGVAMVKPVVIDAKDDTLLVGDGLYESA